MKKLLILLTLWCSTITANAALITIDVEDKAYDINDTLTADIYISEPVSYTHLTLPTKRIV